VPPGTNGAMSTWGTFASIAGGAIMGLTMLVSILVESSACRQAWPAYAAQLLTWGCLAGGLGSLVRAPHSVSQQYLLSCQLDSFLGATLQRTRYSKSQNKILSDHSKYASSSGVDDVKVVSGIAILTNNQVRLRAHAPASMTNGIVDGRSIWFRRC
jgi:uncharacterized membrane protein